MQQAAEIVRSGNCGHGCSRPGSFQRKWEPGTWRYRRGYWEMRCRPRWRTRGALLLRSLRTAMPRAGLLVVAILAANAGADQTKSAKRIELYDFLKKRALVDGLTNLDGGLRRHRLEIVWISHVGSQALGNEFYIYNIITAIAEVLRLPPSPDHAPPGAFLRLSCGCARHRSD